MPRVRDVEKGRTREASFKPASRGGCVHVVFSYVPQPKCLLTFWSAPFNHQSSKSRFNYEPVLLLLHPDSIRTNKRAFSAIMGLSIGWQPRTETLCMFASGCVCVCVWHIYARGACIFVCVSVEQSGSDKWTCDFSVCACACPYVFQPLSRVLSVHVGVFFFFLPVTGWRNEALNYFSVWVSSSVWHVSLMSSELIFFLAHNHREFHYLAYPLS